MRCTFVDKDKAFFKLKKNIVNMLTYVPVCKPFGDWRKVHQHHDYNDPPVLVKFGMWCVLRWKIHLRLTGECDNVWRYPRLGLTKNNRFSAILSLWLRKLHAHFAAVKAFFLLPFAWFCQSTIWNREEKSLHKNCRLW